MKLMKIPPFKELNPPDNFGFWTNKKTGEKFVSGNSSLIININNSKQNRTFKETREDIRCFGGERIYSYYFALILFSLF